MFRIPFWIRLAIRGHLGVGQYLLRNFQIRIGGVVVTVVNVAYSFKDKTVELS